MSDTITTNHPFSYKYLYKSSRRMIDEAVVDVEKNTS